MKYQVLCAVGNYMCHLLRVGTLHLAHCVFTCQADCPYQQWHYMRQHCLWTFTVKCSTTVPDISRQQTDKQSNVVFVSTIRNWHCTLLFLSVQNVRHHVTKCVWCIYNIGTLFYLTIHIITFTHFHVMASSEVLIALHICHGSGSTCLVQHTAVNVLVLLTVFL